MKLHGEGSHSGRATEDKTGVKLNKLMDMSRTTSPRICLKFRHLMMANKKILFVIFKFLKVLGIENLHIWCQKYC